MLRQLLGAQDYYGLLGLPPYTADKKEIKASKSGESETGALQINVWRLLMLQDFTKWLLYFKAGLSVELSIARWTRHEAAHRRTVKLVHPDILGPDSGDLQAHRCGFIMNCQIVEYSVSKKIMQKKIETFNFSFPRFCDSWFWRLLWTLPIAPWVMTTNDLLTKPGHVWDESYRWFPMFPAWLQWSTTRVVFLIYNSWFWAWCWSQESTVFWDISIPRLKLKFNHLVSLLISFDLEPGFGTRKLRYILSHTVTVFTARSPPCHVRGHRAASQQTLRSGDQPLGQPQDVWRQGVPWAAPQKCWGINGDILGSYGEFWIFQFFLPEKNKTVHKSTWILKQQRIMRYDQTFGKGGPLSSCQASSWMKAFVAAAWNVRPLPPAPSKWIRWPGTA